MGRAQMAAWVTTALIAAAIGLLTLTPGIGAVVAGNDKLSHFAAFAVLVLPLSLAYPDRVLPVFGIAVLYGVLIEVVQPHFGRGAEVADVAADVLGAAVGGLVGALAGRRLAQWRRKSA